MKESEIGEMLRQMKEQPLQELTKEEWEEDYRSEHLRFHTATEWKELDAANEAAMLARIKNCKTLSMPAPKNEPKKRNLTPVPERPDYSEDDKKRINSWTGS